MTVALERLACAVAVAVLAAPACARAAHGATPPPVHGPPAASDRVNSGATDAARFCPDANFVAYSTLEPSGQRVTESFVWDAAHRAYVIRGLRLAYLLDDPGVSRIPDDDAIPQMSFRIAIRSNLSSPVDRMCQQDFQEKAECDPTGVIVYTQIYTGCDLQRLRHVITITPDHVGSLALLELSFADVQGNFSAPLFLSADSDLRLNH